MSRASRWHYKTLSGVSLCGYGNNFTTNKDAVTCSRCLRRFDEAAKSIAEVINSRLRAGDFVVDGITEAQR